MDSCKELPFRGKMLRGIDSVSRRYRPVLVYRASVCVCVCVSRSGQLLRAVATDMSDCFEKYARAVPFGTPQWVQYSGSPQAGAQQHQAGAQQQQAGAQQQQSVGGQQSVPSGVQRGRGVPRGPQAAEAPRGPSGRRL